MRNIFKPILFLLLAVCGLYGLLHFWAGVCKPKLALEPIQYSQELIDETANLRDVSFGPEDLYAIQRDVDYAEGESSAWYPKREAPILAELVNEGKLPPVAERVGPEPVVIEGVDGVGNYGGTWLGVLNNPVNVQTLVRSWNSGSTLVRWSPLGYPIVPHVAKGWKASPDRKEWTIYLRKGIKWSDGHPFTADDILYWWNYETKFTEKTLHLWMHTAGQTGEIIKIDTHTVKFVFPVAHALFLEHLATAFIFCAPRHYMEKYHPEIGNDELIEAEMKARNIPTRRGLYVELRLYDNPEHPRLWPWLYRTYKANPPRSYVRNPYYWAVDSEGNQLPYVDRILLDVKNTALVPITAAEGGITMQAINIYYLFYTLFMSQREENNYEVLHWYSSGVSDWALFPNLNRYVDPEDPRTEKKWALLNDKRFRRALSLAINRQDIIDAIYDGIGEPAQVAPGRGSYFYHEGMQKSYTEYDPERANQIFDEIELMGRDSEGYRTFKDGTRMVWYLDLIPNFADGPSSFIIEDWKKVGIHAIEREISFNLFNVEHLARKHDFFVWGEGGGFNPVLKSYGFLPMWQQALGYTYWYVNGGLYGNPEAKKEGGVEPPPGHPVRRCMELCEAAQQATTIQEQRDIIREVQDIMAEELWAIGISSSAPDIGIVKKDFKNVPRKLIYGYNTPSNGGPETFYFENPKDSPGTIAQIKREMTEITTRADLNRAQPIEGDRVSSEAIGRIIRHLFLGILAAGLILGGVKHPYIRRRFLIMLPTLLVISIITFIIIQLPPSNFIDNKILQAQVSGDYQYMIEAEQLRELFPVDEPILTQYMDWLGLPWFLSFKSEDRGLMQGHLGFSMESRRPVNDVVGDRILLTVFISLGSILFTWAVALPVGIYSAVRQYSFTDYIFTLLGFIGMCVPSFLLALLIMYWSKVYFGISMTGLFSPEYAGQLEWNRGKVIDLLQHIWVPIVVLGITGTASMIRVMRGNLLDELRKPYVTTAMAKGVRPFKLLIKYPVRIALNPFISGIGILFPQLISGGAIVAMVLSLPTVGPMMLEALMTEDMSLAGSMLMVLSLLGVMGTLVSDLLLMWLDPRIRMEGGLR